MNQIYNYQDDLLHVALNDHIIVPLIDDDLLDENIAAAEIIWHQTTTIGSVVLAAGFIGCFIEIMRTVNPEMANQLQIHNPYVECSLIVAAGAAELAAIKLTHHKYSFFSLASNFVNGAIEDIRFTMYEDDPEYYLHNAVP